MIEDYEYYNLINPSNLFDDISEVYDFTNISKDINELNAFLDACIDEELYDYCSIISNRINYLYDENFSI